MDLGKAIRLRRILPPRQRAIFCPLDDSLLAGPTNGLANIDQKVAIIAASRPNAIIGFKGLFLKFRSHVVDIPLILNLTASTTLGAHTRKKLVSDVEEAISLGCDAVSVHVNMTSAYESEMLCSLGLVSKDCDRMGMPLLAHMYVRKESPTGADDNYHTLQKRNRTEYTSMVAHAARVGSELGADIIKIQFLGDEPSVQQVVSAAFPTPVVIAGGPLQSEQRALIMARHALNAGVAGISFGRNVFGRSSPEVILSQLRTMINEY